jgi:hypothetical protein
MVVDPGILAVAIVTAAGQQAAKMAVTHVLVSIGVTDNAEKGTRADIGALRDTLQGELAALRRRMDEDRMTDWPRAGRSSSTLPAAPP